MRVLVTRPRDEGEEVAAALVARGHRPVLAPVLRIVPLPAVLPAGHVDAIVLTSRQAAALAPTLLDPRSAPPVFAVGRATGAEARRVGFRDVRVGAGDGVALVDLVCLTLPPGGRLLHLAGQTRKAAFAAGLGAAGYRLITVELYAAEPVHAWSDTVPVAGDAPPFDACLHFSRRSAEQVLAATRDGPLMAAFDAAAHHCLSEDVAAPLRANLLPHIVIAMSPNLASLLQGLGRTMA